MRVTDLITFLQDFKARHGNVDITALTLPPPMPAPVPLSPLLGSDDDTPRTRPIEYSVTIPLGTIDDRALAVLGIDDAPQEEPQP